MSAKTIVAPMVAVKMGTIVRQTVCQCIDGRVESLVDMRIT